MRRVLHTFAYGGAATDGQIKSWSAMAPGQAIREMLTFDRVNPELSPVAAQDATPNYAAGLADLQAFWSSDHPDNLTCPTRRGVYAETLTRTDGNVVLRNAGLQQTWIAAVRKRGLNPFRHKVGFWLANYQMAVNLHDTEPPLIREHYDSALDALEQGAPFHEVLATGATSAAVAREYGHRNNAFNNRTGKFRGNDDFAREFHQLFFRINGDLEDPDYHENTTVEHTARALTGMNIDKEPDAYGTTLPFRWWVAPLDFTDHYDATGRRLRNLTLHHADPLEILGANIVGVTAEDKLFELAGVAINHSESLDNIPVAIVNFFADDNLNADKVKDIRAGWRALAGQPDDLLRFLQAYGISTAFHREDRYKYRTAFSRNMTIYGLNTVDNEEAYRNSFTPLATMRLQGANIFIPLHDVFGGQTSLNAANNPNLFKEAHNRAVDYPNNLAKTAEVCRDADGTRLWTWRKDWARAIPTNAAGLFRVKDVGEWLWKRFIGDGGSGYGALERAHVGALLAMGMDLGYLAAPTNPDAAYAAADLDTEPLRSLVAANEGALMELDNPTAATRREANRRVGMAINFVTMTPAMFATGGTFASGPAPIPLGSPPRVTIGTPSNGVTFEQGVAINFSGTASDPEGGDLAAQLSWSSNLDGAIGSGSTFSTTLSVGSHSITAAVTDFDGQSGSDAIVLSVMATPVNNPPVAESQNESTVESTPLTISLTGSDADGDALRYAVGTGPVNGGLRGTAPSLTYTPNPDFIGADSFTFRVSDGTLDSAPATVSITVNPATPPDRLECKEVVYKPENDRFRIEVQTTDETGARTMTAAMDVDGNGTFERDLGVVPINRGSSDTYERNGGPFANPNPSASSVLRVLSDLGGVCTRNVKID